MSYENIVNDFFEHMDKIRKNIDLITYNLCVAPQHDIDACFALIKKRYPLSSLHPDRIIKIKFHYEIKD